MIDDFDETEDYLQTECSRCGEVRRCVFTDDLYIREINPEDENEPAYWCYSCLDSRRDDI